MVTQVSHPVNGSILIFVHYPNSLPAIVSVSSCKENKVPLSLEHWIDTVSHIGRKNNLNSHNGCHSPTHSPTPISWAELLHHPTLWMPLLYQWTTVHPNNPKLLSLTKTASGENFAQKHVVGSMIRSLKKGDWGLVWNFREHSSLMVSVVLIL